MRIVAGLIVALGLMTPAVSQEGMASANRLATMYRPSLGLLVVQTNYSMPRICARRLL